MILDSGWCNLAEKGTFKSERIAGRAVSVAASRRPAVAEGGERTFRSKEKTAQVRAVSDMLLVPRREAQSYAHAPSWLYRTRENERGGEREREEHEWRRNMKRKRKAEDDESEFAIRLTRLMCCAVELFPFHSARPPFNVILPY